MTKPMYMTISHATKLQHQQLNALNQQARHQVRRLVTTITREPVSWNIWWRIADVLEVKLAGRRSLT